MRRLVLVHQQERLSRVAPRLQPVQGQIGDHVGGVTGMLDPLAVADHGGVVIRPLADQDFVMVKTGGGRAEVPFADDGRLVAGLLQQLGKRLLSPIKGLAVADETVSVAMLAGKNDRSTRPANRIGHKAIPKQHSFAGQTIQVGCLVDLGPVGAQRLRAVVVGKDKQDVGPFGRPAPAGAGQETAQRPTGGTAPGGSGEKSA